MCISLQAGEVLRSTAFVAPNSVSVWVLVGCQQSRLTSMRAVVWIEKYGMWCERCSRSAGTRVSTALCLLRRSKGESALRQQDGMVLRVVGESWVCIKKGSGRRGNSTIRYSEVDWRQSRKRRVHSRQQKNVCVSIHAGEHDSSGSKFGTRLRGMRPSLYGRGPLGEVKATKSQGQKHGMKGIQTFRALASEQEGSSDVIAAKDRRLFKPRMILGSSVFGEKAVAATLPFSLLFVPASRFRESTSCAGRQHGLICYIEGT